MATATLPSRGHVDTTTSPVHDRELRSIALGLLVESPLNPRKRYDPVALNELADSIGKVSIITPLTVRPMKGHPDGGAGSYEIAAGHRRKRAAAIVALRVGMTELQYMVPCIVRDLTDEQLIEILNIENLQRQDIHPLEEAQGFKTLLTLQGFDVAKIAERIGREHRYVYDGLRLLQLTKPLQKLFFDARFTRAHAVILSRLSAKDQERATVDGGLWQNEYYDQPDLLREHAHAGRAKKDEDDEFADLKPKTARELQSWVDKYVRFQEDAKDVVDLFPETHVAVQEAAEKALKVIKITHHYHVVPEAKDAEGGRTYGPQSWTRADGKFGSKTCEHSVLGVVAVGPERGQSYLVCVDKHKCRVHYGTEIRERDKREKAKLAAGGKARPRSAAQDDAAERKRIDEQRRAQAESDALARRWKKSQPFVLKAIGKALESKNGLGVVAPLLIANCEDHWAFSAKKAESAGFKPGATAESIMRYCGMLILGAIVMGDRALQHGDIIPLAKQLGVDLKKIMDDAAPEEPKRSKDEEIAATKAKVEKRNARKIGAASRRGVPRSKKKLRRRAGAVDQFMKPMQPSEALAAVLGSSDPLPRTEITKKLWQYIKKHGLQDQKERRVINCDEVFKGVMGKGRISMFEMTKAIVRHITPAKK